MILHIIAIACLVYIFVNSIYSEYLTNKINNKFFRTLINCPKCFGMWISPLILFILGYNVLNIIMLSFIISVLAEIINNRLV